MYHTVTNICIIGMHCGSTYMYMRIYIYIYIHICMLRMLSMLSRLSRLSKLSKLRKLSKLLKLSMVRSGGWRVAAGKSRGVFF